MTRFLALIAAVCVVAAPALARPWRGITPGRSTRGDVVKAFGDPSTTLTVKNREVLAYFATQAIKGTSQVQFKLKPRSAVVERIDVFPGPVIDRATVEASYGPRCATPRAPGPCFTSTLTDDAQIVFRYASLSLAIFFKDDANTVQSFVFLGPGRGEADAPAPSAAGEAEAQVTRAEPPPAEEPSEEPTSSPTRDESTGELTRSFEEGESGTDASPTQVESTFDGRADLEDPLKIGGSLYLRTQTDIYEKAGGGASTSFDSPSLVEVYLDGRPNDRIRGMVTGRLTYDFTKPAGETVVLPGATPPVTVNNPGVLLDELWLRFDIARFAYFTVGKQKVKWGASQLWNPTDFLSPQQRDLLNTFDTRLGTDLLKIHFPWERMGWNFYAIGVFDSPTTLAQQPRAGGALRAELVLLEAELSFSGVVRDGRKPKLGMDLSSPLGPFDIHFELAAQRGLDAPLVRVNPAPAEGGDFASGFQDYAPGQQWLPSASGGLTLEVPFADRDSLGFVAEYFYNSRGYTDRAVLPQLIRTGRYQPFYVGQQYAALSAQLQLSNGLSADSYAVTAVANLSDRSAVLRLDANLALLTHLTLEVFGSAPLGQRGGEFRPVFTIPSEDPARPPAVTPLGYLQVGLGLRVKI